MVVCSQCLHGTLENKSLRDWVDVCVVYKFFECVVCHTGVLVRNVFCELLWLLLGMMVMGGDEVPTGFVAVFVAIGEVFRMVDRFKAVLFAFPESVVCRLNVVEMFEVFVFYDFLAFTDKF